MAEAARTKTACRVVDIDRQKLADLIASEDYPCAPATSAGVSRVFEIDDMVALYLFARLNERGLPAKLAGAIACRVREGMQNDPSADRIVIGRAVSGASGMTSFEHWNPEGKEVNPGMPLMVTEIYDVRNIRTLVRAGLEREARVLGDD